MIQYQGNKSKIAGMICNRIRRYHRPNVPFWDLCCGSGSISLYWTEPNYMVDLGPWGLFWKYIKQLQTEGRRPVVPPMTHKEYIDFCWKAIHQKVPTDPAEFCYTFIILQRESFQGTAINIRKGKLWNWKGFQKKNWAGTDKIQKYLDTCMRLKILDAFKIDINKLDIQTPATVYIDPDYKDTSGYDKRCVNVPDFISRHPHCDIFVSEHEPIEGADIFWNITKDSGRLARRSSLRDTEYLSYFRRTT